MSALTLLIVATLIVVFAQRFAAGAGPAQTHPFNVHDLQNMDRISDPKVSPDGKRIVFVRRVTDLEQNKGVTDLWLVNMDGSKLRRLTSHPTGSGSPRWSTDGGAVWFLSARSGSSQVWRIPIDGGEAQQVTRLALDIDGFHISPDGATLVLSIATFPDCPSIEATKQRLDDKDKIKATGRTYDRLFIRHWDTWKDGRRAHLFAMPVGDGDPIDLMKSMEADVPSKPFGDMDEVAFTPNGKSLVFALRNLGRQEAWSTRSDLYMVPLDGSAEPMCVTESNQAWLTHPIFSPDGNTLAYLATQRPGYESDRFRIMLRDWPDGQTRVLADSWDRSAMSLAWAHDGKTIFAIAQNLGHRSLFAIDVAGGGVVTTQATGTVTSAEPTPDGRVVFSACHLQSPADLFSANNDGTHVVRITEINAEKLATVAIGDPEQFSFDGWNDEKVHAWVVQPVDFDASRKYPVAFLIHGGPQGSFGSDFHYRWNPQVYAGAGYGVVMVDFHGSTGYGQAFTDAICGDWGGKPFVDLQKGLAAALDRYPWMDGDRVAALGASYGGYMINWIAGNWPDRFRCLVNHDGNLCERLAYYDTEELWFPEWEHGGTPWENPEAYEEHNPINHVAKWKTPMLVIHSAKDFRVVDTQGISTFTALQRRGIPSELLYFPDENHWVLKPANAIQWHEKVLAWLDRWTKDAT